MFNLSDPNISYILFSPESETNSEEENKSLYERACSILYSKDYTIISVKGFCDGLYENSFIALPKSPNNDDLRKDSIYLLDSFHQDSVIIKYVGEESSSKILSDGSEKPMSVALYNSDLNNKTYLYNGVSFSFIEEKRYYSPKQKSDLKNGMIIEYFNNNKWNTKQISDIDKEYEELYRLLIKYNKLRIESN
jgi:hypothetical protein